MIPALPELPGLGGGTTAVLLGLGALLVGGTLVRGLSRMRRPDDPEVRRRWSSLLTWWTLFLLLGAALALGRAGVVLLATGASLLLLRESLRLVEARWALPLAAALTGGLYLWAWLDWPTLFLRALPILLAILLLGELVRRAPAGPRLQGLTAVARAFFLATVGPSFLVAVASLPPAEGAPEARMGWLVLLLVLTELNDSAQAWWGRAVGSRRLAPRISPNKTWEGLAGGVATTVLLAAVLAPLLTDIGRRAPSGAGPPWLWSAGVGLVVALAATAGDLLASAQKRRAGVKDAGDLLPGHGGVLDRLDSLTVSGPVFFYLSWLLWS